MPDSRLATNALFYPLPGFTLFLDLLYSASLIQNSIKHNSYFMIPEKITLNTIHYSNEFHLIFHCLIQIYRSDQTRNLICIQQNKNYNVVFRFI